jgi:hypothetical protein
MILSQWGELSRQSTDKSISWMTCRLVDNKLVDSSTKSSRVCLTDTDDLPYTIHENISYEVHKEAAGLREAEAAC